MSKTTLVLILALGLGGGFLIARYAFPAPAPVAVEAPKPAAPEKVAPVAKARVPRTVEAPAGAVKSEDDIAKEEFKARAKAFGEETKRMVEEISGGDQAKLQRAMFAGMSKPEGMAIMNEARELGEAMRNATPAEREALQAKVEKLHRSWTKDRDYLAPPTVGKLAALDPAQVLTPPEGLEVGYVPIATRQELAK